MLWKGYNNYKTLSIKLNNTIVTLKRPICNYVILLIINVKFNNRKMKLIWDLSAPPLVPICWMGVMTDWTNVRILKEKEIQTQFKMLKINVQGQEQRIIKKWAWVGTLTSSISEKKAFVEVRSERRTQLFIKNKLVTMTIIPSCKLKTSLCYRL